LISIRYSNAAFVGDLPGLVIAGVHVPENSRGGIGGEDAQ